jgi:hypothetical protein
MLLDCNNYKTLECRLHLKKCNLFGSVEFTQLLDYILSEKIYSKSIRRFGSLTVRKNVRTDIHDLYVKFTFM